MPTAFVTSTSFLHLQRFASSDAQKDRMQVPGKLKFCTIPSTFESALEGRDRSRRTTRRRKTHRSMRSARQHLGVGGCPSRHYVALRHECTHTVVAPFSWRLQGQWRVLEDHFEWPGVCRGPDRSSACVSALFLLATRGPRKRVVNSFRATAPAPGRKYSGDRNEPWNRALRSSAISASRFEAQTTARSDTMPALHAPFALATRARAGRRPLLLVLTRPVGSNAITIAFGKGRETEAQQPHE
jgi:hypothetical protein